MSAGRFATPMRRGIAAVLLCAAVANAWAQTQTASSPAAAASAGAQSAALFDFWLGDWSLAWRNADGSTGTGRKRITKILDGTVIEENFEAPSGGPPPLLKGRSLSVLSNCVWRQSWVDNQGGFFAFTGQAEGDRRIFITPLRERDGKTIAQRMVFYAITRNALTWD